MRQLTILVPYQNRKSYLDIFLSEVPKYLERVNGITDYAIYVAEQQSPDRFNLALSRNVAALLPSATELPDTSYFMMWTSSPCLTSITGLAVSM
jgi:hypothetical protein